MIGSSPLTKYFVYIDEVALNLSLIYTIVVEYPGKAVTEIWFYHILHDSH